MSTSTKAPPDSAQEQAPRGTIFKPVFIPASAIIFALIAGAVIYARVAGDDLEKMATDLNTTIADGIGWWYVIAVNLMVVFTLYVAFSRMGNIRLGRDDERPEFNTIPWFLMLFSAGMGIGLVFFGLAEPVSHFLIPPEAFGNDPASQDAAREAIGLTMLNWGLHPWAIYSVVGLGLAYMSFRRGRPLSIRWLMEPLLGRERVEGWMGHAIDVVAIVGTLFGVATSFGFGITQILAGLEYLGWAESSNGLTIGLIAGITALAVWSVFTGVHKGLKWLSNINMTIAALLAVTVLLVGPTLFLLQLIPQNFGMYTHLLPEVTMHTGAGSTDGWEAAWTIFYWGWWTSWAPFVGMFIARISRGRTVREFVLGVLLAPTLVSLLWFTIFGGAGIKEQLENSTLAEKAEDGSFSLNSDTALFQYFETLPSWMAVAMSVTAMLVIVFFFITSADSGALVIDMLATGGSTNTPAATRIYWASMEGIAAGVLLVVGGSAALTGLQTLSITTAAPFSVILVLACFSLFKAFRWEVSTMPNYIEVLPAAGPATAGDGEQPKSRKAWSGLGGLSATLAGFGSGSTQGDSEARADSRLVPYRRVHSSHIVDDPATGAPTVQQAAKDPLAGETFDTVEFRASQEFVNQGGSVEQAEKAQEESGQTAD